MKRKISIYTTMLALLTVCLFGACAPMTEAEREEREYSRIEWRERFIAHRDECNAIGGRLEFDGSAQQDRYGVPKHKVRYICTLPPMAVVGR